MIHQLSKGIGRRRYLMVAGIRGFGSQSAELDASNAEKGQQRLSLSADFDFVRYFRYLRNPLLSDANTFATFGRRHGK